MSITDKEKVRISVGAESVPPAVFDTAWNAAEAYVTARVRIPADTTTMPGDLVQAVTLLTSRYLARRNSPEGMLGLGDLGATRLPFTDGDVQTLIAPYRPVVFG